MTAGGDTSGKNWDAMGSSQHSLKVCISIWLARWSVGTEDSLAPTREAYNGIL